LSIDFLVDNKSMKISYNWLKSYLDFDLKPEPLCEILTDIGLEVEGLQPWESVKGGLKGLVVGHVLSAEKHPNADKLKLTKVDVGGDAPLSIVCGAPNVAPGQKVIVATVGTTIYPLESEPFTIKKAKIRGEASQGMICAEDEIGLGTSHVGIMVLADSNEPGKAISEIFEVEHDYIIDIGLTPNRSDAFSHTGVAKDLKAALQINHGFTDNVKMPEVKQFPDVKKKAPVSVKIIDNDKCHRYAGLYLSNVTIKESPNWLKNRLTAVGVRPINNVVDITNFILHELGQPLHAFDADKITGNQVLVKSLKAGTPFLALDEKKYKLTGDDLVICNEKEGMCIAGVFGGLKSGVTENTKNIFLESACFEPINTRKTSFKHLLRTDAAQRFEKGVDPNISVYALKRAALLMQELAGAEITTEIVDVYPQTILPKTITVNLNRVRQLIGDNISNNEIINILLAMDMEVDGVAENTIEVKVPTNKYDVLREADIVEEVLRIYGFNKVPVPEKVNAALSYSKTPTKQQLQNKVSDFLVSNGFVEAMNLSISNAKYYTDHQWEGKPIVPLLNNLNADLDVMRGTMLFSGLENIRHNINRQNTNVALFEFGKTYWKEEESYSETENLSLFLSGKAANESWESDYKDHNFYHIKNKIEHLLQQLGIDKYSVDDTNEAHFSYNLSYQKNNKTIATFGLIKKEISKYFDVKQAVLYANINWSAIVKLAQKQKIIFTEIPKYPKVRRDLSLTIDETVTYGQIEQISTKSVKHILKEVNLFDIYKGDKIEKGKKSYAVSFYFQDDKKTLTDKEVDKVMNKLIKNLSDELGAVLR